MRLLPPREVIDGYNKDQLIALIHEKKRLTALIEQDPARFFRPNNGGQRAFLSRWDQDHDKRVLLFLAGNKTGKTTAGALLMGERLLGRPLWDREARKDIKFLPVPAVGIIFTEDFESHRDTVLPTILSWWPKDEIVKITTTHLGAPSEIFLKNGSVCKFKTYAQGADTAEGKDWDIVWNDEPPPPGIYSAQFRGIVSLGGEILITATLLKEAWIYDEIDKPYAQGFESEIHDNEWISIEAKEAFLASLTDEERETRESGKPFNLTGTIYKHFKDAHPYVIEPFEIPEQWPIFMGVDPHERKPVHIGFFTLTPQDEIVMFDYALLRGNLSKIFEDLENKITELGVFWRPTMVIMDPNRGRAVQMDNQSWEMAFEDNGYTVKLGEDNVNIGHAKMYEYLTINPRTQRPRFVFTHQCRGRNGPIWQMSRYSWDEWANKTRHERDIKEKPRDFAKDFPDICRYVAMEDLRFDTFVNGPKVIQTIGANFRPYGRVGRVSYGRRH